MKRKKSTGTDVLGSRDAILAGLTQEVVPVEHPCPDCGRGMKDANTKGTRKAGLDVRICASSPCRLVRDWSSGSPKTFDPVEEEPEPVIPTYPSIRVGPEHPCPECGRAMKDANTRGTREAGLDVRICSSKTCRAKADWASGKAEPYIDPT